MNLAQFLWKLVHRETSLLEIALFWVCVWQLKNVVEVRHSHNLKHYQPTVSLCAALREAAIS